MNVPVEKIIELSELRIGNYLEYEGQIVHVTSMSLDIDDEYEDIIGFCKLGSFNNEYAAWNRALADKLNRIPINPEWLIKFGFENGEIHFSYHTHIAVRPYKTDSQGIFPGKWQICLIDSVPYNIGTPFEYIHEIQNIYHAITTEELIFKP